MLMPKFQVYHHRIWIFFLFGLVKYSHQWKELVLSTFTVCAVNNHQCLPFHHLDFHLLLGQDLHFDLRLLPLMVHQFFMMLYNYRHLNYLNLFLRMILVQKLDLLFLRMCRFHHPGIRHCPKRRQRDPTSFTASLAGRHCLTDWS